MSDGLDPLDPSPYTSLKIQTNATVEDIKKAYRKLALTCHPDKITDPLAKPAAVQEFHLIQQAYEILSDESRKRRWDERKKLADLKEDIRRDRGPLRRTATDYEPPRSAQTTRFETRGAAIYEERVPKSAKVASPKFYDEDIFSTRPADSRSTRKYEDRYADEPSPRKVSGRGLDDRREVREAEKLREKKAREADTIVREQKARKKDKEKKRDMEAKLRSKTAYAEEYSSDSEVNDTYRSSKPEGRSTHRDDDRGSRREHSPRRSGRKADREHDPELGSKLNDVYAYMGKAAGSSKDSIDLEDRRPGAGRRRGDSYRERRPLSPPLTPIDTGRRSSGDDGRRPSGRTRTSRPPSPARKSSRDKRKPDIEIVEPSSYRKSSLQHTPSDPRGLKGMSSHSSKSRGEPQRAQTFNHVPALHEQPHPGVRRSGTEPVNGRAGHVPPRSSTLKNMVSESDSDDSSSTEDTDATPIIRPRASPPRSSPPRQSSTRYKIHDDSGSRTPRTVSVEPEDYFASSQDHSPKTSHRSSNRPPLPSRGASTRGPLLRNASYADPPPDNRPPRQKLFRAATERMPPINTHSSPTSRLPYEIPQPESSNLYSRSPKTYDDRHGRHGRRGSEDITDRDAYPGSHHKSHGRPSYTRGTA